MGKNWAEGNACQHLAMPTTGLQLNHGIPLGDANWMQGLNSPFYNESHVAWQAKVREFCQKHGEPIIGAWDLAAVRGEHDKAHQFLKDLMKAANEYGILPATVGTPWPKEHTTAEAPANYDHFHEMINVIEQGRVAAGFAWAFQGGLGIGLPPLLMFGMPNNPTLLDRVIKDTLSGEKMICLCITEPAHGSDVSGLRLEAEDKGDHFLLNGEKKWITNGIYADYFTVACRTDGDGPGGLSMLLVERSEGLSTRKMECMGVWPSGTTYVEFDDVKVPKANIIGKQGEGFKQVMYNFNHERWVICCQVMGVMRCCLEEAISFARQRTTFGKKLVEHQVIQHKLGEMGRMVEATQGMLENITYQMDTMTPDEQNAKLGGHIALLKVQSTKTCEFVAREAVQIFGGAGYTRSGKGEKVERAYREVRAFAIPGGSEEIMLNLAAGQFRFVDRSLSKKAKL